MKQGLEDHMKEADWREDSLYELEEKLTDSIESLHNVLFSTNRTVITAACAQVANRAMMIADTNRSRY